MNKGGLDRRLFLGAMLGGAVGMPLAAVAAAAQRVPVTVSGQVQHTSIEIVRLADNLVQITGAGSNVILLTETEGVLMVDGGLAEISTELMKVVAQLADNRPVGTLFNTHWHWDHTGSNESLAAAGATIIAHENTRLWLGADFFVEWENRAYKPRPAMALPTKTFYTSSRMQLGSEMIEYAHAPQAHTDGDLYVFLPRPNILIAGDLLSVGRYPILDYSTGGWIGGLQAANKTLLSVVDAQTRIVPGNGPVQNRDDLQAQYDMLTTLKDRFWQLIRKGMSATDLLAAGATSEFDERWGNPELFVRNAYKGMWGHARELGGIV